jgi:hypothetical protein
VALMLQSCLGGSAPGFHIKFQSDQHFCFSVFCKAVGFKVYNLRRIISSCFDVYFHLWSKGAPHWERENFLWEQEQLKEWTVVQSRKKKYPKPVVSRSARRVRFAPNLVQDSPKPKHSPTQIPDSITVGAFTFPTTVKFSSVFGRLHHDLDPSSDRSDPKFMDTAQPKIEAPLDFQFSNSNLDARCAKCLALGHSARSCSRPWHCNACFNYGHKARWCCNIPKVYQIKSRAK